MCFAAHCAHTMKLAASTINTYLYGIRDWHLGRGHPDPLQNKYGRPLVWLETILRGIKKIHTVQRRPRLPITVDILRLLVFLVSQGCFGSTEDIMFIAALNLTFFGFLHCGEFTITSSQDLKQARHLCMKNIVFYPSFDHPTSMTVHLKYSKTDPFGHGHTLTLFVTGQKTCPVRAMHTYFKVRGFCPEAPLFVLADNRPLTRTSFVTMLRVVLGKLGLDSTLYAGHSFRIGAATTAAAAGLPDWLIQALGRWSSACYLRYIHVPLTSLNQASTTLANASNVW